MVNALRRILWLLLIVPFLILYLIFVVGDVFLITPACWVATGSAWNPYARWLVSLDLSIFGLRP